jgi:hypothetical protein
MTDELRKRVIEHIKELPPEKLKEIEKLLTSMECGDLSPLSRDVAPKRMGTNSRRADYWPHAPYASGERHE